MGTGRGEQGASQRERASRSETWGGSVLLFFDCLRYLSHISTQGDRAKGGGGEGGMNELARLQFQLGVFMATTAEWELPNRPSSQHLPAPLERAAELSLLALLLLLLLFLFFFRQQNIKINCTSDT